MMVVNLKGPRVGMERWCKISYIGQASPPLPLLPPPPQKKSKIIGGVWGGLFYLVFTRCLQCSML